MLVTRSSVIVIPDGAEIALKLDPVFILPHSPRMYRWLIISIVCLLSIGSQAADAPTKFAALRYGKVKMHTGPGMQYPTIWVFQRKLLPVEVLTEFEKWKKIADPDGTTGWVQETMLTDHRAFLVTGSTPQAVHHDPDPASSTVASLQPGVVGKLTACQPTWCHVKVDDYEGWLPKTAFWGGVPGESFEK